MYTALSPGAIGVRANTVAEAIAAAKIGGFAGVEFNPAEIADLVDKDGAESVTSLFSDAGIRPSGFGLPTDWRGDAAKYRADLEALPRLAGAAAAIGGARTMTWIMPGSNERAFEENRRFHIERFTPIAAILKTEGVSLGLEFIGTPSLRHSQKFPFVYRMAEMLALGAEIGPNVGLLLDCWHWHTSGGTTAEMAALEPEQIVYVHVNDAPAGVPLDELQDGVRALPGATGVIDIAGFLRALRTIGYDGPVAAEPFEKKLSALATDGERLLAVRAAMDSTGLGDNAGKKS